MQDKFKLLVEKINGLTLRERILVLLTCLVVMYQAWDSLVWMPLVQQQHSLLARESQINEQMLQMQVDLKILSAKANLDPDLQTKTQITNLQAQLDLGEALAGSGRHQEALDILLSLVERDRHGVGESARKMMLDVFRVLPDDSELVQQYRRKLSTVLY